METNTNHDTFRQLWERRKSQWHDEAKATMPDDEAIIRMAQKATQQPVHSEAISIPITMGRRGRWLPYAAAASLLVGIAGFALSRQNETSKGLPVAKTVNVNGQTVRFLCNNGCTANDVLIAANEVINK